MTVVSASEARALATNEITDLLATIAAFVNGRNLTNGEPTGWAHVETLLRIRNRLVDAVALSGA